MASTPTPPDLPTEEADEDTAANLPLTMAASQILTHLPAPTQTALESAGELLDAQGRLRAKGSFTSHSSLRASASSFPDSFTLPLLCFAESLQLILNSEGETLPSPRHQGFANPGLQLRHVAAFRIRRALSPETLVVGGRGGRLLLCQLCLRSGIGRGRGEFMAGKSCLPSFALGMCFRGLVVDA